MFLPKFGCWADNDFQDFRKFWSIGCFGWMLCRAAIRRYCWITGVLKFSSVPVMSNVMSCRGDIGRTTAATGDSVLIIRLCNLVFICSSVVDPCGGHDR